MARFVAGAVFGLVVGVVAGAAAGLRADDRVDERPADTALAPVEVEPTPTPAPAVYSIWDRLAACESTGRWNVATGNGYFGGLQMDMTFWRTHGGLAYAPRPDLASRAAQIAVAERGLAVQGWGAWPACSRRLGLR